MGPGRNRDIRHSGSRRRAVAGTFALLLALIAVSCTDPTEDASAPPPEDRAVPTRPAPSSSLPAIDDASPGTTTTAPAPARFHVAPDGSDEDDGTSQEPWETLTHALGQLQPGDTLLVHGGTYREQVQVDVEAGTPEEPIIVQAAEGEEPVIEGLLRIRYLHHWILDGINVTWDEENNDREDHMVKLTDGDNWVLRNSELWGARSFAALLVAGTSDGQPSGWQVVNNCIHDTVPSNGRNEDHLVYVNTGPSPTDGLIENNLLFGADNGSGIKLGGSSEGAGGAHGVTVRDNTIIDTAQPILVSWQSSDNAIIGNFFAGTDDGYGHIRGYELDGEGNVASDNGGDDHDPFILNDDGFMGVEDGGNNVTGLEMEMAEQPGCGLQGQVEGYGLETSLRSMPNS